MLQIIPIFHLNILVGPWLHNFLSPTAPIVGVFFSGCVWQMRTCCTQLLFCCSTNSRHWAHLVLVHSMHPLNPFIESYAAASQLRMDKPSFWWIEWGLFWTNITFVCNYCGIQRGVRCSASLLLVVFHLRYFVVWFFISFICDLVAWNIIGDDTLYSVWEVCHIDIM